MKNAIVVIGFGVTFAMNAALAHESFLKPASFYLAPNTNTTVALFNGTFDKSDNTIARERMNDVTLMVNGKVTHPSETLWRDNATTSYLDLALTEPGTHVVGVSTKPKIIEMSADDFDNYLRHDGIEDVLKARQAEKAPRTPVLERYSKHVRTVLQVGDTLTDDHKRSLGYPAEILLSQHPATLKTGDTINFEALFKGQAMKGQLVYASYEGHHGHDAAGGHIHSAKVRTDDAGKGSFQISEPGKWYITLINMQKTSGETQYESNWSTVTFEVR